MGARLLFILGISAILWLMIRYEYSAYLACVLLLFFLKYFDRIHDTYEKVHFHHKAVLITGCDTGFGHHSAKRLDSKGFTVFACCLFPEGTGANDLRQTCSNRLKILPLDVTKDENVAHALKFVKENLGSNELWAIVNNAGIVKGLTVEFSSFKDFKDTFDVNTFGPIRMTKAFLPLLKKSKGRIINVTSAAARLVSPEICSYTMSKHAVRAFSECLSMEMESWGVKVISIEPEAFRTPLTASESIDGLLEDSVKEISEDVKSAYDEIYMRKFSEFIQKINHHACSNIDIVIDDIESAICEKNPGYVYKPSRNSFVLALRYLLENLPTALYRALHLSGTKFLGSPLSSYIKRD